MGNGAPISFRLVTVPVVGDYEEACCIEHGISQYLGRDHLVHLGRGTRWWGK
ncbi:MAG: hypothetical protein FWF88_00905 [Peptococcaceae bacterium]|nr:hypothetical protein [Peptococcaceae bacterium]